MATDEHKDSLFRQPAKMPPLAARTTLPTVCADRGTLRWRGAFVEAGDGRRFKRQRVERRSDAGEAGAVAATTTTYTSVGRLSLDARPYLIAVARVYCRDMTFDWSCGRNRPRDDGAVENLVRRFDSLGVGREEPTNFMRAVVPRAEVERMTAHLGGHGDGHLDFGAWREVNGTMVEVVAGRHRAAALEAWAAKGSNGEELGGRDGLWWTCELYDRDRLPRCVRVGLEANVETAGMRIDSHGATWLRVARLLAPASDEETLPARTREELTRARGGKASGQGLEHVVCQALGIATEARKTLPTRRLVTLWRDERWGPEVTRWCRRRIGEATFNISRWEWMMQSRVEDVGGALPSCVSFANRGC